jgi:hypothetical protein
MRHKEKEFDTCKACNQKLASTGNFLSGKREGGGEREREGVRERGDGRVSRSGIFKV